MGPDCLLRKVAIRFRPMKEHLQQLSNPPLSGAQ
jgi:hypothetical protein